MPVLSVKGGQGKTEGYTKSGTEKAEGKSMTRNERHRNRYDGTCKYCGEAVPARTGFYDYEYTGEKTQTNRQHHKKYNFFCVCEKCFGKHTPMWK